MPKVNGNNFFSFFFLKYMVIGSLFVSHLPSWRSAGAVQVRVKRMLLTYRTAVPFVYRLLTEKQTTSGEIQWHKNTFRICPSPWQRWCCNILVSFWSVSKCNFPCSSLDFCFRSFCVLLRACDGVVLNSNILH